MSEKKSIFVLADNFLREAQGKSEYVDIDSAAIYSDEFIEDFVGVVHDEECEDFDVDAIDRMVRILKQEQFNYDFIDEDGNLYNDAFIKHFKHRYVTLQKEDITKNLGAWRDFSNGG